MKLKIIFGLVTVLSALFGLTEGRSSGGQISTGRSSRNGGIQKRGLGQVEVSRSNGGRGRISSRSSSRSGGRLNKRGRSTSGGFNGDRYNEDRFCSGRDCDIQTGDSSSSVGRLNKRSDEQLSFQQNDGGYESSADEQNVEHENSAMAEPAVCPVGFDKIVGLDPDSCFTDSWSKGPMRLKSAFAECEKLAAGGNFNCSLPNPTSFVQLDALNEWAKMNGFPNDGDKGYWLYFNRQKMDLPGPSMEMLPGSWLQMLQLGWLDFPLPQDLWGAGRTGSDQEKSPRDQKQDEVEEDEIVAVQKNPWKFRGIDEFDTEGPQLTQYVICECRNAAV